MRVVVAGFGPVGAFARIDSEGRLFCAVDPCGLPPERHIVWPWYQVDDLRCVPHTEQLVETWPSSYLEVSLAPAWVLNRSPALVELEYSA